ncbi:MAG TPA: hypothetical protein VNT56_05815, partial [Acidimicrobiales bacterium]|nr:hypothetical protein [Acidimicrobiales bacterium]
PRTREVQPPMKKLLKKLSRADQPGRRDALEQEAAEQIRQASGQAPPPEAASWAAAPPSAAPAAPAPGDNRVGSAHGAPAPAPGGRRMTVQERMAARS